MNQERVSPRKLPGRARSQCVTHPGSKPTAFGPLDRYCHRKLYSKKLLVLIWPIFIEMLLQILVGNVDQLMIAGYQQEAVGAIANANQVLSTLLMVFSMISMAESILISQYRGAGDLQQLERVYTLSCVLNVLLSLVVSVVLFCADDVLLRLLRVPEIFLEPARQYIQIVGGGSILQALFLTFSAIFRSNQHMKTSMLVSILMNGINIAGNALLIYGAGPIPAMGVRGVAIATNLSRLAGLSALMFLFWRRKIGRINLSCLRPFPTGLLKKLVCIGIPAGGEVLSYNLSQLVVLSFVNGFGPDSTTARAYCSMISNVALLYCLSAAQATQIIVDNMK